jgi:hypothetical protein
LKNQGSNPGIPYESLWSKELDWGADGKDQAQKGKIKKKSAVSLFHLNKFGDLEAVDGRLEK